MKAWPLLLMLTGCSASYASAPKADERSALTDTATTGLTTQAPSEVHIHVRTYGRVAAYQVVIRWDPAIARIASIERCSAKEFPADPQFDRGTFASGTTVVFGNLTTARGADEYHLLTVRFERVQAGETPVTVELKALYDDSDLPKRVRGDLSVEPSRLRFE